MQLSYMVFTHVFQYTLKYFKVFIRTFKYFKYLKYIVQNLSISTSTLHLYKKYLSISTSTQEGVLKCP